jgi:hypothetical protein
LAPAEQAGEAAILEVLPSRSGAPDQGAVSGVVSGMRPVTGARRARGAGQARRRRAVVVVCMRGCAVAR